MYDCYVHITYSSRQPLTLVEALLGGGLNNPYFMIDTFSFVIQQPLFNLQP